MQLLSMKQEQFIGENFTYGDMEFACKLFPNMNGKVIFRLDLISIPADFAFIYFWLRLINVETNTEFITNRFPSIDNVRKNHNDEMATWNKELSYKDIMNKDKLEFICNLMPFFAMRRGETKPICLATAAARSRRAGRC